MGIEHRPGTLADEVVVLGDQQRRGHTQLQRPGVGARAAYVLDPSGPTTCTAGRRTACCGGTSTTTAREVTPRFPSGPPCAMLRACRARRVRAGCGAEPRTAPQDASTSRTGRVGRGATATGPRPGRGGPRRQRGDGGDPRVRGTADHRIAAGPVRPPHATEPAAGQPRTPRNAVEGRPPHRAEAGVRIAVVGTGISGLASAWLLAPRHEVHVFEREPRLGGHTHTVSVPRDDGPPVPVDTGFIVYNEPTYPLLVRLFDELGVATQASDMSWALRCDACDLEYAGNARGVVAQPRNLADPTYLRMLADIARFNRLGRRLVDDPRAGAMPLGRFLEVAGFGHGFRAHYLQPMAAAIWSSGTSVVERFPVGTLLRFFANHGLLGVTTHHPWRTVVGGTSSYLGPLSEPFADRIHRDDAVTAVTRDRDGVTLRTAAGHTGRFDAVVLAAHADESLGLLTDPSALDKELLGAWSYSENDTWLHTDTSLLPRSRRAWASWNYLLDDCRRPDDAVSLSYHMNRLQTLDEPLDYVVTLNPARPPSPATVVRRMSYTHPTYTAESVASQSRIDELNGQRRTFYAGAYQRDGFHEDGLWSAVRAVSHLGVRWPW
ncbi:NAD(P)-binding protein [Nitriliruptoraceae bacterium ZYF776]|nr:NAD(P)-binding protein [Profundirhabdus halotolerans]